MATPFRSFTQKAAAAMAVAALRAFGDVCTHTHRGGTASGTLVCDPGSDDVTVQQMMPNSKSKEEQTRKTFFIPIQKDSNGASWPATAVSINDVVDYNSHPYRVNEAKLDTAGVMYELNCIRDLATKLGAA
jgi:hypothetical protein